MLPTEVKVGGVHYTVAMKENMIAKDDLWGEVDYFNSHINIDSSLSDDRKGQVLIHEITHAIFLEAGYKEQDEDMVNRIGIVLHQVLKDNPNLLNPQANITSITVGADWDSAAIARMREELKNTPLTALPQEEIKVTGVESAEAVEKFTCIKCLRLFSLVEVKEEQHGMYQALGRLGGVHCPQCVEGQPHRKARI